MSPVSRPRTGSVLMKRPIIDSTPGRSIERPEMVDPNSTLSRDAVQALLTKNFRVPGDPWMTSDATNGDGQIVIPPAVPEPAALVVWGLAASVVVIVRVRRRAAA